MNHGKNVAFISTPSLYFALPSKAHKQASVLLELDKQSFAARVPSDSNFVHFDFNDGAAGVPVHLHGTCDMAVIDPPFVTHECWQLYVSVARALLQQADDPSSTDVFPGKVLATTVAENAQLMHELFGAQPVAFKPCIPHLVYQYTCFVNYSNSLLLHKQNPEVDGDAAQGTNVI